MDAAEHVPTFAAKVSTGTFGVFCHACSQEAGDYVWPCREGKWEAPAELYGRGNDPDYAADDRLRRRTSHYRRWRARCRLNDCGREQGIGAWCHITGLAEPQPVCEEHWQALCEIFPTHRERPT